MSLRKLERQIIKAKHGSDFKDAWTDHRKSKYVVKDEEGNVIRDKTPKNTQQKKKIFYDNKEQYFRMFEWAKLMHQKRESEEDSE